MTARDVWYLRLALIRFVKEASSDKLLKVALYAAKEMAS